MRFFAESVDPKRIDSVLQNHRRSGLIVRDCPFHPDSFRLVFAMECVKDFVEFSWRKLVRTPGCRIYDA